MGLGRCGPPNHHHPRSNGIGKEEGSVVQCHLHASSVIQPRQCGLPGRLPNVGHKSSVSREVGSILTAVPEKEPVQERPRIASDAGCLQGGVVRTPTTVPDVEERIPSLSK